MYYRIGLDLGIASVGAAVISTDEYGNPKKIEGLYSRVFDACEVPKTGESLAKERRENRGVRRRLRRRRLRLDELIELFKANNIEYTPNIDVNELRYLALDDKISETDFASVIYTLIKHRGFKSNKKNPDAVKDKDEGLLLSSANANHKELVEGNYRTVGEMLYKKSLDENGIAHFATRNRGGEYTHTILRDDLVNELNILFDRQRALGNSFATEDNQSKCIALLTRQRKFDDGPSANEKGVKIYGADFKIGFCEYEDKEYRAPKSSYSVAMFDFWQKLNNIVIKTMLSDRPLTADERALVYEKFVSSTSKELTFAQLRKYLKLNDDERFNLVSYRAKKGKDNLTISEVNKECEKVKFISAKGYGEIVKALDEQNQDNAELIDEIATILVNKKSIDNREKELVSGKITNILSTEEISRLVDIDVSKVSHLSFLAISKILPYLEQGAKYTDALVSAGYSVTKDKGYDKTKLLELRANDNLIGNKVDEITSPVVKRTVTQTIKVLNAIIRKYGSPLAVNVELARDLSKSRADRDLIKRQNDERYKENEKSREAFASKFQGQTPSREAMLRYRLYEEQGGKCPYSGKVIDIDDLFNKDRYEIDHIMPYSRCFNDSFNNKVLVLTGENRKKGNRLPYEYMNESQFSEFKERVTAMYTGNNAKLRNLLKENMDENEMKDRALNDTRYISRFMLNLIGDHLLFAEGKMPKRRVRAVAGGITAKLRYLWGIKKVRADGARHHAVDAAVIACASDGAINKISQYFKNKENMTKYVDDGIVKADIVKGAPEPYEGFSDELNARCLSDANNMADGLRRVGYSEDEVEEAKPIFVSHMPNRKGKGAIHDATIYNIKEEIISIDKDGVATTKTYQLNKVPLGKLTFKENADGTYYIKDFYDVEHNRKLHDALVDRYVASGCDSKKAFSEPFYKPCDNGVGPLVRKVTCYSPNNSAVEVGMKNKRGYANNGNMIRVDIFTKVKVNSKGVIQYDNVTKKPILEYYGVPVYTADLYKGVLPMRAALANKPYGEWPLMDEDKGYQFAFSVYPHDLLYIEKKGGLELTKVKDDENSQIAPTKYTNYVYYRAFGRSNAAIIVEDDTKAYEGVNIGIKTLQCIKKCNVDVLGNISFVGQEKRQSLSIKKN